MKIGREKNVETENERKNKREYRVFSCSIKYDDHFAYTGNFILNLIVLLNISGLKVEITD